MLKWYISRHLKNEALKNIEAAKRLSFISREMVARHVLVTSLELEKKVVQLRPTLNEPPDPVRVFDLFSQVCNEAKRDRQKAIVGGASSRDNPDWLMAALVEDWSSAVLASLIGRISPKTFREIDGMFEKYAEDVIGAEKVAEIKASQI